jgi:hypothetical protein
MEGNMNVDEIAVRERLDTAVGASTPDVVSLVAGGITAGRGMRRRRRVSQGLAAVAGCAAAATVLTMVGGVGDLFSSERKTGPSDVVQRVPATPRGFAAAVMSHTDELGTLISAGGFPLDRGNQTAAEPGMRGAMLVGLGYKSDAGVLTEMQVVASPQAEHWEKVGLCSERTPGATCTEDTLPDGTPRAIVELSPMAGTDSAGSPEQSMLAVGVIRDNQFVIVIQTVTGPAQNGMNADALQAIATDPAVGLSTTAELNAEGEQIEEFIDSSAGMFGGGGSDSASESDAESAPESAVESAPAPPQGSGDGSASD